MTLGVDPDDRMGARPRAADNGWQRHVGTLVRVGVVLVVLGAAGASSWHYLRDRFLPSSAPSGPVPVIGPGNEPIKEAPKQPGGMQVPDQDKIILNGAAARPKIEQILPPPPAPLPSPTPPPASSTAARTSPPATQSTAPAASTNSPANASAVASAPAPAPTAPTPRAIEAPAPQDMTTAPAPPVARPTVIASTPPQQKPAPTPAIAHESVPPALAGHGWFVQLGAVRSTAAAQAEWTRLKHAHADLLAPLKANAVRIERGGAVLYRIEAGPLADAGAASHLCGSLLQRHVACIVLRP